MLTKHIFPKQLSHVSWLNLMNCINLVLISATNSFSKLHTASCINKSLLYHRTSCLSFCCNQPFTDELRHVFSPHAKVYL